MSRFIVSSEELTTAEQLAMRLMAGDEDPLVFQSLRYAALAQANEWEIAWLARELVEIFDRAATDDRSVAETAAVTLGLLKAARLGRTADKADRSTGRINPAIVAAGITAIGLIVAATINLMGNLSAAKAKGTPTPQPTVVAEPQPNVIQIVVPTPMPVEPDRTDGQPAATAETSPLPSPPPSPTPTPATSPVPEAPEGMDLSEVSTASPSPGTSGSEPMAG